jgi:glycerophosphoryl diester phosphodiesterase
MPALAQPRLCRRAAAHAGAIARFVRATTFMLNIEIKPTPGHERATGRAVGRAGAALWAGAVPPLLSSFQPEALRGARRPLPDLPRALLLDSLWPAGQRGARLGCVAVITNHR